MKAKVKDRGGVSLWNLVVISNLLFPANRYQPDSFQAEQWFWYHHQQWRGEEVRIPEGVVAVGTLQGFDR